MGRCKYGQPIRTRVEEAREEARRRALVFKARKVEEDDDEEREVEEDEDEGSEDEKDEEEGSEDEEDKKEGSEEEGSEEEEDEKEGSQEEGSDDEGSEDEGRNDEGEKDKGLVAYDNLWWTPSCYFPPLKGKAVEPKVGYHRGVYVKGTNEGVRSEMTMEGLVRLAGSFPWPEGIELRLPCATGGALAKYPGCIVVYEDSLKAGFRLPLHPFIRDFLSLEKYCPAELTPDSWRCILAVLLKFKELYMVPSYEAFKSLYRMHSKSGVHDIYFRYDGLISNPSSMKRWRRKWFLVSQSEEFHFNFPMYPGDYRWCKGYTGKKDNCLTIYAVKRFLQSLPDTGPSYKKVITARRLVEAELSLRLPVKGPSICERYYSRRKREAACSSSDLKKMEDLSKKAKKSLSQFTSAVGKDNVDVAHEEEEEEEEEGPQEDVEEEEEEEEDPQEDVEEEEEEEEREDLASADPQERPIEPAPINSTRHMNGEKEVSPEELANARPQERPIEAAPINSTHHLNGTKEVCEEGGARGRFSAFPPGSEWINSISTFFRPEISTALRQLPELILAAQRSEQLERDLDESRKENGELRRREMQFVDELTRKEREFQSRIERLEVDKKNVEEELIETQAKLTQTAQKALELFDIASPSMKIKL